MVLSSQYVCFPREKRADQSQQGGKGGWNSLAVPCPLCFRLFNNVILVYSFLLNIVS